MGPIVEVVAFSRAAAELSLAKIALRIASADTAHLLQLIAAATFLLLLVTGAILLRRRRYRLVEYIGHADPSARRAQTAMEEMLVALGRKPADTRERYALRRTSIDAVKPAPHRPAPSAQLVIKPLKAATNDPSERLMAGQLRRRLECVLAEVAPGLALRIGPTPCGAAANRPLARYELSGALRHMGDRVRIEAEMTDAKSGTVLFRFRYQSLPSEQEIILAELVSRVLKATLRHDGTQRIKHQD